MKAAIRFVVCSKNMFYHQFDVSMLSFKIILYPILVCWSSSKTQITSTFLVIKSFQRHLMSKHLNTTFRFGRASMKWQQQAKQRYRLLRSTVVNDIEKRWRDMSAFLTHATFFFSFIFCSVGRTFVDTPFVIIEAAVFMQSNAENMKNKHNNTQHWSVSE